MVTVLFLFLRKITGYLVTETIQMLNFDFLWHCVHRLDVSLLEVAIWEFLIKVRSAINECKWKLINIWNSVTKT